MLFKDSTKDATFKICSGSSILVCSTAESFRPQPHKVCSVMLLAVQTSVTGASERLDVLCANPKQPGECYAATSMLEEQTYCRSSSSGSSSRDQVTMSHPPKTRSMHGTSLWLSSRTGVPNVAYTITSIFSTKCTPPVARVASH